jgi:CBS domain-containing protein
MEIDLCGGVFNMAGVPQKETMKSRPFKKINEDATLGKALALFENSIDILIVFDKKNEYSGILHERSILRTDLDPGKSKVKSFKTRAPKIVSTTDIQECARLMIENNLMYLPIFEKSKVTGIISYLNILKSSILQNLAKHNVKNIMTSMMTTTTPADKISLVYNKFKKSNIFSIPVLEDGKYSGMIYLHDTLHTLIQHKEKPEYGTKYGEKQHLLDLPVRNIMTRTAISALDSATLGEVIDKIIENRLDCISIIDAQENLQAVISVRDLLKLVSKQEQIFLVPKITINSDIKDLQRDRVNITMTEFVKKFSSILSQSEVEIYMREHKEKHKDQKLIYTRLQLHAHHDKFEANAEGWGYEHSLKEALEKIEKQIMRKKISKKHLGKKKY